MVCSHVPSRVPEITRRFVHVAQAECLVGRHIGEDDVARLYALTSLDSVRRELARIHQLQPSESSRDQALLQLHFYNLAFAKEQRFTPRQASAFISIACEVVFRDQEDTYRRLEDSFAHFKDLLFRHAVDDSPLSMAVFSRDEAVAALDHTLASYFRHFRLYNYVLTPTIEASLVQVGSGSVEQPIPPRPLQEAVPLR